MKKHVQLIIVAVQKSSYVNHVFLIIIQMTSNQTTSNQMTSPLASQTLNKEKNAILAAMFMNQIFF
jgi:hypothetical protein